jgi:nuclear pore complex protein Nup54
MSFTFGTPNTSNTNNAAPTFGFGNNNNSPAKPATFTFGNNNTNAQANSPAKQGFSFGNNTNTQASPAKTAFAFGGATGATTTTTPSFSFGGSTAQTSTAASTFSFGGTSNTGGGFSFGNNAQAGPTQDSSQVIARINSIISQIDPNSQYDRFKFAFYNSADPNKYRKPEKMSDIMWRDALVRCPDRDSMVPVLARGFDDLKARRETQEKQRLEQEEMIHRVGANIEEQLIKQQLFLDRLSEYRKIVANNITRILNILGKVEYLRRKGQPLNRNEEHLFSQVEKMREELCKPGQYSSRVNDLMSNVKSQSMVSDDDYPSLDDESIVKVQEILSGFIKGLSSIMKDVNDDVKSVNLIDKSFHESAVESSK